jgi:Domain of unknown function (DUF1707)
MADSRAAAVRFPRIVLGEVPAMTGPGDEIAAGAGGHGHQRASHADREQAIGTLKAAFVQGMVAKDEFDARVGQTLAARTYADLAALTADLPAGLATAQPPPKVARTRTRPPMAKVGVGAALIGPPPAIMAAAFLAGSELLAEWFIVVMALYLWVWMAAGTAMLTSRRQKRSGRRPPRPAAGRPASQRPPSAAPDIHLHPARDHPRHTAEAAPSRHPSPLLLVWRARISMPCVR